MSAVDRTEDGEAARSRPSLIRRLLPLLVLAAGFVLFFALDLDRFLSLDTLRVHRQFLTDQVTQQPAQTALIFVLVYVVAAACSLPGAVFLTIGGGFLFGAFGGGALAVMGATGGAIGAFLAARTALGDVLRRRLGPRMRRMEDGFRANAFSYMLVLRLMPVFPFWLVNLAAALLEVPLRIFAIGTLIGIIPGALVYASIGNGIGAVLDAGGTPNLGIIFQPQVLLPLVGLAFLSLVPVIYRRLRGKPAGSAGA